MKLGSLLSTLFLALVAFLHLLRLIFQVPVTVGTLGIPMWMSVLGVIGPGILAVWLWQERHG